MKETDQEYRATIEKEQNVVTITLDSADEDALIDEGGDTAPPEEAEDEPQTVAEEAPLEEVDDSDTQAPAEETVSEAEAVEPAQPEEPVKKPKVITHVVVEGDTLWDIAERYVKDPFRYPELARYSNIKNPDLIYPGDIVRIQTK